MLRDKSLIPLSRQHQHALALCVRIDRASPIPAGDIPAWQAEIVQIVQAEIGIHFAAEEQVVLPAARLFPELVPLVEELITDHEHLRESFSNAETGNMDAEEVAEFARHMSAHIRKEERQLFERMQGLMKPDDLEILGQNLEKALQEAAQLCIVPTAATGLRPAK